MEILMPVQARLGLFLVVSLVFLFLSRRPLVNPRCHGFYRFLVFESTLILVLVNLPFWFRDPFSPRQLLSWALLLASVWLVLDGLYLLKKYGGHQDRHRDPENFAFENTAHLVSRGIYRYIRHPMYSSLLLLSWGAALKNLSPPVLVIGGLATFLLVVTAKVEEHECLDFFGEAYDRYSRRTRMFIPFLF